MIHPWRVSSLEVTRGVMPLSTPAQPLRCSADKAFVMNEHPSPSDPNAARTIDHVLLAIASLVASVSSNGCNLPYPGDVPDLDAQSTPALTIDLIGNGNGRVTSQPTGIDCPGACTTKYSPGQTITLTATADASSIFLGWSPPCSGRGTCALSLDRDETVTATFAVPGSNIWVEQTNASTYGAISSAKFESNGDVIVGGYFLGSGSLGGKPLSSSGGYDGFVARLRATDGSAVWLTLIGGTMDDSVGGIDVDKNGDVFVGGMFTGTVSFGGTNHTSVGGSENTFVSKLDGATGNYRWTDVFGESFGDEAQHVAADPDGNVLVSGVFHGPVTIGTQPLAYHNGSDVFLARFAANGDFVWARAIGGDGLDDDAQLSSDGAGNAVVAGSFQQMVDFGAGAVPSAGMSDCFVAKYRASDGSYLVAKRVGNANDNSYCAAVADPSGNMYLTGAFSGALDVGGAAPLNSVGGSNDTFIVRYSSAGSHVWSNSFGNDQADYIDGISLDAGGNILLTGRFLGTESFGGADLSSAGLTDIYLAHLASTDGRSLASMRLGGAGLETGHVAASDSDNDVFVGGIFQHFSDFGGQALNAPAGSDSDGFALLLMPLD